MSKKKKRKKQSSIGLIAQLLIALGTLLTGIASLIEALKQGMGRKPLTLANIIAHLQKNEQIKIQMVIFINCMDYFYWNWKKYICFNNADSCRALPTDRTDSECCEVYERGALCQKYCRCQGLTARCLQKRGRCRGQAVVASVPV